MKRVLGKTVLIALLAVGAAPAHAVLIDFEGLAANVNIEGMDLGGVSFSIAGTDFVETSSSVPGPTLGGQRTIAGSPFSHANPFEAILVNVASSVSVALGDFNADAEDIFLRAYNTANALIGTATDSLPASLNGGKTLTVNAAGIKRVEFGGTGPFANSLFADNFSFTSQQVPEPHSLALLGIGLFAFGAVRRMRNR